MDSTAFHELIAQVRGTAAELAAAEQKVAAFKADSAARTWSPTRLRTAKGDTAHTKARQRMAAGNRRAEAMTIHACLLRTDRDERIGHVSPSSYAEQLQAEN
jgi:hypothetical protein